MTFPPAASILEEYSWNIIEGEGSLLNSDSMGPTYYAPDELDSDTEMIVELKVTDDDGSTDSSTAVITVKDTEEYTGVETPTEKGEEGGEGVEPWVPPAFIAIVVVLAAVGVMIVLTGEFPEIRILESTSKKYLIFV